MKYVKEGLLIAEVDISLLFWSTSDGHHQIRMESSRLFEGSVCRRSCRHGVSFSQCRPIFGYENAH